GVTRTFGRSFSAQEGRIIDGTNDFVGADLDASLVLFDGLANIANVQRARSAAEAADQRLERARQDVTFAVLERYTALLQDRTLEVVRGEQLAAEGKLLEQIQALVRVGRQPESDLFQQRA